MNSYKVVPFKARIKRGNSSEYIASQLQELIKSESTGSWKFVEVTQVTTEVSPGCLGGLLGQSTSYVRYDLVVFKKNN